MKFAQKMVLVPATESKLMELDQQMTSILKKKSNPDEKIKFYKHALTNFIKNYDPDSHGLSPLIIDAIKHLAQIKPTYVSQFDPNQEFDTNQDLEKFLGQSNLFGSNSDNEGLSSNHDDDDDTENKSRKSLSNRLNSRRASVQHTTPIRPSFYDDTKLDSSKKNTPKNEQPLSNEDLIKSLKAFKTKTRIARTPIANVYKNEVLLNDDFDLAMGFPPAFGTRSHQPESNFSEGIQPKTRAKKAINTTKTDPKKQKNGNENEQQGYGIWSRKRFF